MEVGISWLAFWQARSLMGGGGEINPCFCAFMHRCEDLSFILKDRLRERESCGVTTSMHLKVLVQSVVPYMVITVRDGGFFVCGRWSNTL